MLQMIDFGKWKSFRYCYRNSELLSHYPSPVDDTTTRRRRSYRTLHNLETNGYEAPMFVIDHDEDRRR
jgi:hypothetical protein